MLSGVHPELLAFGEPWLAREPRLLIGCRYAAAGAPRARMLAAQLLLRELAQSTIAASDRRVAEARLHWWIEEAAHWRQGQARHPLVQGLPVAAAAASLGSLATRCLDWLERAPESSAELQTRFGAFGVDAASLSGADARTESCLWLATCARQSLLASAHLASLLPLEICARHGLKRSQWCELGPALRSRLLGELVAALASQEAVIAPVASTPAHTALEVLERRWLARIASVDADRLGPGDVYAAWRAARRAGR